MTPVKDEIRRQADIDATARAPIEIAQRDLKSAELAYTKAQAEATRLNKVRWDIEGQVRDLNAKIRAIRIKGFNAMAEEKQGNFKPYFDEADSLIAQRNNLRAALAYVASVLYEAAKIKEAEAYINERIATAELLAAQGDDIRSRAVKAASVAAEIDPGLFVGMRQIKTESGTVGSNSRSHQLSDRSKQIWDTIPGLRADLQKKQDAAASEAEQIAAAIYNV